MQPLGKGRGGGVEEGGAGRPVKCCEQVAKHVAGTAVVVVRRFAAGIGGRTVKVVAVLAMRVARRDDVMSVRHLSRRGFPTEGGCEHRRQQQGDQCQGDLSQSAAHARILSHQVPFTLIGARAPRRPQDSQ